MGGGDIELSQIPGTKLYRPPGGAFVFLLWEAPAAPPPSIGLSKTWAEKGAPPCAGWYVFVSSGSETWPAVESQLRHVLGAERGWAWAAMEGETLDLVGTVAVELDPEGRTVVAADALLGLPPGLPPLGFAKGLEVCALTGPAGIDGLGLATPGGDPESGPTVGLLGTTSGCISFSALLASPVEGSESVKPLAAAQVDPLDPWDPARTWITPQRVDYMLVEVAAGSYRLEGRTS
jgi:hypothetical protein